MPYRLDPSNPLCVQVERTGGWEQEACHPDRVAAVRHLTALNINVHKAELRGEFTKIDEDQRLAFGWASVVEKDGEVLEDRQGDVLDMEALEKAVYGYALNSRDADEMHQRTGVGQLVESIVFTAEKIEKMGLPADVVPQGVWMGFYISDDAVWKRVKAGELKMFSIAGSGVREDYADTVEG